MSDLKQAVAQRPSDVQLRRLLAEAYAGRGFVEEAVAEYLAVLELGPTDSVARERLQSLFARRAPRWLPEAAAKLLPFPHVAWDFKPTPTLAPGQAVRRGVLRTVAGFAPSEGQRFDPAHGWFFAAADYAYAWSPKSRRWLLRIRAHRDTATSPELAEAALAALISLYEVARHRVA